MRGWAHYTLSLPLITTKNTAQHTKNNYLRMLKTKQKQVYCGKATYQQVSFQVDFSFVLWLFPKWRAQSQSCVTEQPYRKLKSCFLFLSQISELNRWEKRPLRIGGYGGNSLVEKAVERNLSNSIYKTTQGCGSPLSSYGGNIHNSLARPLKSELRL